MVTVENLVNGQQTVTHRQEYNSFIFFMNNGKYAGGGMPFTPASLMNDGFMDIAINRLDSVNTPKLLELLYQVIVRHGQHVYQPEKWLMMRGNKICLENLNYEPGASDDPKTAG